MTVTNVSILNGWQNLLAKDFYGDKQNLQVNYGNHIEKPKNWHEKLAYEFNSEYAERNLELKRAKYLEKKYLILNSASQSSQSTKKIVLSDTFPYESVESAVEYKFKDRAFPKLAEWHYKTCYRFNAAPIPVNYKEQMNVKSNGYVYSLPVMGVTNLGLAILGFSILMLEAIEKPSIIGASSYTSGTNDTVNASKFVLPHAVIQLAPTAAFITLAAIASLALSKQK